MNTLRCTFIAAMSLLLWPSISEAKTYHRSCRFQVMVDIPDTNMTRLTFFGYRATASAGWYIPNTIRVRAYRRAVSCLRASWEGHSYSSLPPECTEASGIVGYDIGSMSQKIRYSGCPAWDYPRSVRVRVRGLIWGNKGCGGSIKLLQSYITLVEGYEINC
jgi:hypothetical protein